MIINIFSQFLVWHFYDVPKEILKGWKNYLIFNLNYFSVPILLKTYFSYWRKYHSSYGRTFELWINFEALIFNLMSRIIGAILRTFFILAGLLAELLILAIGPVILIVWLVSPVLLLIILLSGLKLLI